MDRDGNEYPKRSEEGRDNVDPETRTRA